MRVFDETTHFEGTKNDLCVIFILLLLCVWQWVRVL